jgi:hypothetical protein
MADGIKIGTQDATYKVGSTDVSAIYLGSTLVYSGGTPPTPPTPTYTWRKYYEGETVPSRTVYGVKLYIDLADDFEIDFGDSHDGIAFIYEIANNEWTALDVETFEPIDISEYFDGEECYTILFSDLGYDGIEIAYPIPGYDFAFDIELYVEPSLQWVEYNNGDTIPSDLDVYGISGTGRNLLDTFDCNGYNKLCFQPARRNVEYYVYDNDGNYCASGVEAATDPIELIFSNIGCSSYINQGATVSGTIKLYIYA